MILGSFPPLKKSFLADAPPHSVRDRPPGCRTAFVGGLPENITEEILQEVFEKSGPIETIRLGKKNFAHIRFITHESVEQAMYLSGGFFTSLNGWWVVWVVGMVEE